VKWLGLLLLGIVLQMLDGVLCRSFHLQWMHPDPLLFFDVYLGLQCPALPGGLLVLALGFTADSFAGTPRAMMVANHLFLWMLIRWARHFLAPGQRGVQLGTLLGASLLYSLLIIMELGLMEVGSGPILVNLKAMFPLAGLHVLLAGLIWKMISGIYPPSAEAEDEYVR